MDLAAGRREAGKEADTAHIALVGLRERSAWLGGRGPACFSPASGGAAACGRGALVQRGHGGTLEPCQWEGKPPGLARFSKVPASGIGAF